MLDLHTPWKPPENVLGGLKGHKNRTLAWDGLNLNDNKFSFYCNTSTVYSDIAWQNARLGRECKKNSIKKS